MRLAQKPVFIAFCHRCSQRLCNRSIQTLQEDQSVKIGVIDPAKLIAEAVRGKFKSTGNEADKSCDLGLSMLLHALNQIVNVCFNSLVDIGIPYGIGAIGGAQYDHPLLIGRRCAAKTKSTCKKFFFFVGKPSFVGVVA